MFYSNQAGENAINFLHINAIRNLMVGIPYMFIMLFMLYFLMAEHMVGFYFLGLPVWTVNGAYLAFRVVNSVRRANRTIQGIGLKDDTIIIYTFKILWINSKDINISSSQTIVRKSFFSWYGKTKKMEGIIIAYQGQEFYLVKDFFDDFDKIVKKLAKYEVLKSY